MHECTIKPRVSEINGAGHIGNTVVPVWFEEGRVEFLRFALEGYEFPYMLARIEQNFRKEIYHGSDVLIKTGVEKIGNSSLAITQEVWQNNALCADGKSVLVHFDRKLKRPSPITETVRNLLIVHQIKELS